MSREENTSAKEELLKIASLIGCKIDLHGDPPDTTRAANLMVAAAREALTNAVRHAHADEISLTSVKRDGFYDVVLTDNGSVSFDSNYEIIEGEGLKNLRNRLEQEGGALDIVTDGSGVTLIVKIPT